MSEVGDTPTLSIVQRWTQGWRPWLLVGLLGCVLYLPFLGSVGLWDPWEPHYAEVSREMVERGNWLVPTWEVSPGQPDAGKHFYSKPAGIMWLMALPMEIFGIHDEGGGITDGAEWFLRFPFALLAILGLLATFGLANRFFGGKVGLLAALILGTSPQYAFIARQAMTDMPLVALVTAGLSALVIGGFDRERERAGLLYLGYALCGLAVLAVLRPAGHHLPSVFPHQRRLGAVAPHARLHRRPAGHGRGRALVCLPVHRLGQPQALG
mgnify:CR=1 FL=1